MSVAGETAADGPVARLKKLDNEAVLLEHIAAAISWDQETYMPQGAVEERAHQQALLQSLVHERNTAPEIGELLAAAGVDPGADEQDVPAALVEKLGEVDAAFLREKRRQFQHSTRLPARLVRELAETGSRGQNAWITARKENDYPQFRPWLEKLIGLSRETADALGHSGERYDALLDQYEPYMTTADVVSVFGTLREGLVDLVQRISDAPQVDDSFLNTRFPVDQQEEMSRRVMTALGYDLDRGRLDRSAHPFTTALGAHDVRITTRYDEELLTSSLFSTIHETGHALYELGVGEDLHGTLLAEGTSLGIHESQSRMWENMIGRSRPFWQRWMPDLQAVFPRQLRDVPVEAFYRAVNKVQPSLIRVEADEVTYSLHIILRFELEQQLINGTLSVEDLPEAWNAKMKEFLDVVPPRNAEGVLQDVHWSFGAFGYFPTYALGNLYAAQFLNTMEKQLPSMWEEIATGKTRPILDWLRSNIHQYGKVRSARQLIRGITGTDLDPGFFLRYLTDKYGELYSL
ncbi:MAG: carboxypeptidase M32 [Alkalispirochaeta sp.]